MFVVEWARVVCCRWLKCYVRWPAGRWVDRVPRIWFARPRARAPKRTNHPQPHSPPLASQKLNTHSAKVYPSPTSPTRIRSVRRSVPCSDAELLQRSERASRAVV